MSHARLPALLRQPASHRPFLGQRHGHRACPPPRGGLRSSWRLAALAAAVSLAACSGAKPAGPPVQQGGLPAPLVYACADGVTVRVQEVPPAHDARDAVPAIRLRLGDSDVPMREARSASGFRYEGRSVAWEWFGKGDEAQLRDRQANRLLARDCRLQHGAR